MHTIHFQLSGDHIALCDLLKVTGIAGSSGQGKALVAAGEVRVDGYQETRKTAKIRSGQMVECLGSRIEVAGK